MTKPVGALTVFGSNTTGTTTQLDNNFAALLNNMNDLNTYGNYLTDTGAANAYVVTLAAGLTGPRTDGLPIQVKISATNTGASVLNYNATGNANILNVNGTALTDSQLTANGIYPMQWSNALSSWILQSPTYTQTSCGNILGANVSLNNTSVFFDGPSIAQGNVGSWLVSGSVTVTDTAGAARFNVTLNDGTTTIASAAGDTSAANKVLTINLTFRVVSVTGNLRLSVKDVTSTSGLILFNASGSAKDSKITAVRIA